MIVLVVSFVRIKFLFVLLFYEVIFNIELDILFFLGFRDFFLMFVIFLCFLKFVLVRFVGFFGLNGLFMVGEDLGFKVRVIELYKVFCLGSCFINFLG